MARCADSLSCSITSLPAAARCACRAMAEPAAPGTGVVDLALLERWLCGWSLARGVPLPRREGGGLVVEVGAPDQLRRHVFVDAGAALQACAAGIDAPRIFLKATVDSATLRAALPPRWQIESPRYLMCCDGPLPPCPPPPGYILRSGREHGALTIQLLDGAGAVAAAGKLVIKDGCAVFDQIETAAAHRRRGLGRALMAALDALACAAGVDERLLVATEAGRSLYLALGWRTLAPYATAVLAPGLPGAVTGGVLRWRVH